MYIYTRVNVCVCVCAYVRIHVYMYVCFCVLLRSADLCAHPLPAASRRSVLLFTSRTSVWSVKEISGLDRSSANAHVRCIDQDVSFLCMWLSRISHLWCFFMYMFVSFIR